MTTIDNIMALADGYANSYMTFYEQGMREALRTALTEAFSKEAGIKVSGYVKKIESLIAERDALTEAFAFQPDWADFNNGRECGRIEATEALAKDVSLINEGNKAQPEREPANWYCTDKSGRATLCADKDDALQNAKLAALDWPNNAPYRAVQLVEAQPAREPLIEEQITTIAHRKASKYTHRSDPESHSYGFVKYTLIDFVRAIEREHGIGGER